ncbi:hypothetical protein [Rhodopirellula sallentina]|uniref:Uncharacterized protein n=1 Tax=Rhodopirellula sallentina SM41 TaxID=1263870 RepID=M5UB30_9BACT|nr:hypothetical protein [Rhodopirellula sallentina]EMI55056.1 hypothetical protein RSSM_03496 [Rhodopirellula sallentina SM41]
MSCETTRAIESALNVELNHSTLQSLYLDGTLNEMLPRGECCWLARVDSDGELASIDIIDSETARRFRQCAGHVRAGALIIETRHNVGGLASTTRILSSPSRRTWPQHG